MLTSGVLGEAACCSVAASLISSSAVSISLISSSQGDILRLHHVWHLYDRELNALDIKVYRYSSLSVGEVIFENRHTIALTDLRSRFMFSLTSTVDRVMFSFSLS